MAWPSRPVRRSQGGDLVRIRPPRPGFSGASGGRRSHYSYNEIIMTAAQRPHHRNIYCIIYSAVPWFRGENTYKLRLLSSPPHSLPFAAQSTARSLSSFHSSFSFPSCLFFPGAAWGASIGPRGRGGRVVHVLAFVFYTGSATFLLLLHTRVSFG